MTIIYYFCRMKTAIILPTLLLMWYGSFGQALPQPQHKEKNKIDQKSAEHSGKLVDSYIEPVMVSIPGGTYKMGTNLGEPDEQPVHSVTVTAFKMSKYEITYKEFATFINTTGYKTDAEQGGFSHLYTYYWEKAYGICWKHDEDGHLRTEKDINKPVIHVSWNDANEYCEWLTKQTGKKYRLPTEAEWEFAAGNGMKHTKFSWGNALPDNKLQGLTIFADSTHGKYLNCTSKSSVDKNECFYSDDVGTYMPNEFGLYDMSGNVWEWCYDWYNKDYYAHSPENNPIGPTQGENKAIRGANWVYYPENDRITYRSSGNPLLRNYNLGFRIVCITQ